MNPKYDWSQSGDEKRICPECGGRGHSFVESSLFRSVWRKRECENCDGKGHAPFLRGTTNRSNAEPKIPLGVYRHKTGTFYEVLGVVLDAGNFKPPRFMVLYRQFVSVGFNCGYVGYVRDYNEFISPGRFTFYSTVTDFQPPKMGVIVPQEMK